MNAIIIAAGSGKRISDDVKSVPKSMINVNGKPIINFQIEILKKSGINEIFVITGKHHEKFNVNNVKYIHDKEHEKHDILGSLMEGKEFLKDNVMILYSDIIFEEKILEELLNSKNNISVVVDKNWKEYWRLRIDETIDEATETAIFNNKKMITSIGMKNSNANGHFIGLMKLEKEGSKKFKELYQEIKKQSTAKNNDLNKNLPFEKLRIVDLLQGLIERNYTINSILIKNGWLEFDTMNDYELYSNMLAQNTLHKLMELNY